MKYFLIILFLMTAAAEAQCYSLKEAPPLFEKHDLIPLKEGVTELQARSGTVRGVKLCVRQGRFVYENQKAWVIASRCERDLAGEGLAVTEGDLTLLVQRRCK